MDYVKITIPKYKKWQVSTDKRREWSAISHSFFDDWRIAAVMRTQPDAVFCYQWIIFNSHDGKLEISVTNIKHAFMNVTQASGNRYNVFKRLNALSNEGLIEFQLVSNDVLIGSQHLSNGVLMTSQQCSNGVLMTSQDPLEPPETLAALRARTDNTNIHTNNTTTTNARDSRSSGCNFKIKNRGVDTSEEEWILKCLVERRRNKNQSVVGCESLQSLLSLYPTHFEQYRRWQLLPDDIRMAAYAYTVLESQADDQLKYATYVAENGKDWDNFKPYLAQAKKDVQNKDFVVVIDDE